MTPNHSESQVDNGSGWCLLCIWMGRLHLSWLWTAMTEERALHKTWNIGPLYSECFSEYILFLPDDLVPQDLFFSLCSFTVHFYKVLIKIGTAQEQYELWGGNLNLESKNLCQYSFLKMDEWKMQLFLQACMSVKMSYHAVWTLRADSLFGSTSASAGRSEIIDGYHNGIRILQMKSEHLHWCLLERIQNQTGVSKQCAELQATVWVDKFTRDQCELWEFNMRQMECEAVWTLSCINVS